MKLGIGEEMGKHVKPWHQRLGEAFPPGVRRWLYGIGVALTALLGTYGLLQDESIHAWNFLASALFALSFERVPSATDGKVENEG